MESNPTQFMKRVFFIPVLAHRICLFILLCVFTPRGLFLDWPCKYSSKASHRWVRFFFSLFFSKKVRRGGGGRFGEEKLSKWYKFLRAEYCCGHGELSQRIEKAVFTSNKITLTCRQPRWAGVGPCAYGAFHRQRGSWDLPKYKQKALEILRQWE